MENQKELIIELVNEIQDQKALCFLIKIIKEVLT